MSQADKAFTGSIPALYEKYLVPPLFKPHAEELVRKVAAVEPRRILELAAGTGVVTRLLAQNLPQSRIMATDLNEPMIALARSLCMADGVEWRQADAMSLPFPDGSFDAVLCQFGVMFFPDKHVAFGEARRVLAPTGRVFFNVWERLETNPYAEVITSVLGEMFPDDPPLFLARLPYGYHDVDSIRRMLQEAGFDRIEAERVEKAGPSPSATDVATGFCQGTPLRNEIEARNASRLDEATRATAAALAARFGEGPLTEPTAAILVTAQRA